MVNEYKYTLVNTEKTQFGTTIWTLTRNEINTDNKELNENYIIKHQYTLQETVEATYRNLIKFLPK